MSGIQNFVTFGLPMIAVIGGIYLVALTRRSAEKVRRLEEVRRRTAG